LREKKKHPIGILGTGRAVTRQGKAKKAGAGDRERNGGSGGRKIKLPGAVKPGGGQNSQTTIVSCFGGRSREKRGIWGGKRREEDAPKTFARMGKSPKGKRGKIRLLPPAVQKRKIRGEKRKPKTRPSTDSSPKY